MKFLNIALIIGPERVTAALLVWGITGWRVAAQENVAMPDLDPQPEQIAAAVRVLVSKWGAPPQTAVFVVLPPGVGGVVSLSFPRKAKRDLGSLVDFELGKVLPFAIKEIERGYWTKVTRGQLQASVFWLPKSWVSDLRSALARVGLRLSEIFHRAQLVGLALQGNKSGEMVSFPLGCCEQDGPVVHFHAYGIEGLASHSRKLGDPGTEAFAQELALDLLALNTSESGKPARLVALNSSELLREHFANLAQSHPTIGLKFVHQPLDLIEQLLLFRSMGGCGIWLPPDRAPMMAKLRSVVLATVGIGIAFSTVAWWKVSQMKEQIAQLEATAKRLKPKYQKAAALEKQVLSVHATMQKIDSATAGAAPLEPLYRVFKALPNKAWLVSYAYKEGEIEVEGYGAPPEALASTLRQTRELSSLQFHEPQLATDKGKKPFAFAARWKELGATSASRHAPPPVAGKQGAVPGAAAVGARS